MDGLIILFVLLGITAECSRRMWRAFGRGDAATAAPRPYKPSRLSQWLEGVDWERCLGLRSDLVTLPEVEDEPADSDLVNRLENAVIQSGVETILDDLQPVVVENEVPEERIRLENVLIVGRFATFDPLVGQPVGDPLVCGWSLPSTAIALTSATESDETILSVTPVGSMGPEIENPLTIHGRPPEFVGQPVGAPGVFDDSSVAALKLEPAPLSVLVVDFKTVAPIQVSFGAGPQSDAYRIAASLRKGSDDYAVAAYRLNSGDEMDSAPNTDESDEGELPPDPLEEIISEILEEETPVEDPNTLELPLEIPVAELPAEQLRAGEPVGDPGVFDVCLPIVPTTPPATSESAIEAADDAADEDDPSAPIAREVNRISERVETILSNALARPAPSINFTDVLDKMAARSRARKEAKEEAANRLPSQALDDNIARSEGRDGGLKMTEYKVQFEIFEGPLDLLLYLVKKQEVDIYEVNLTQITEEFIKYIELMRSFDLDIAGEFLVMAASLMHIKSKELLPVDQQSQLDDEDNEDDPRWELIRQLVEYKKFKDAAAEFRQLELAQEDIFPNNPPKPNFPVRHLKAKVSVFDLLGSVNRVMDRIDSRETREIFADRWTVSEKIELIRNRVLENGRVKFFDLFDDVLSRTEVVITFLALLELIKLKVIIVDQPEVFADIDICQAPPDHGLIIDEDDDDELEHGDEEAVPAAGITDPDGDEE